MRLVSENSEADIVRQRAMSDVSWRLVQMAANTLRIIRGAGRPYELAQQASEFLLSVTAYRDAVGHYPSSEEISNALGDWDQFLSGDRGEFNEGPALRSIIRGSLQYVASELLGQTTQRSAGRHEIYDGVNEIDDLRRKRDAELMKLTPKQRKERERRVYERALEMARGGRKTQAPDA